MINVRLLREVAKHVVGDPKRLVMDIYLWREKDVPDNRFPAWKPQFPECGTIGCIAGWVVTLSRKIKVPYQQVRKQAGFLLRVNSEQACNLFFPSCWPEKFSRQLLKHNPQTKRYAEITAKRIEHFIATNGAE
jgi:hypothetical protein